MGSSERRCFASVAARTVNEMPLSDRYTMVHLVSNSIVARTRLFEVAVERCNVERHDDVCFSNLDGRFEGFAGETSAAAELLTRALKVSDDSATSPVDSSFQTDPA